MSCTAISAAVTTISGFRIAGVGESKAVFLGGISGKGKTSAA